MKSMKCKTILMSAFIAVFTLNTSTLAQENDDMYFSSKDRKKTKAPPPNTANKYPAAKKNAQQTYKSYNGNNYSSSAYSAREVNPEYIEKHRNQAKGSATAESQESDRPAYRSDDYYIEEYDDLDSEKYTRDEGKTIINNNYYNGYLGGSRFRNSVFYNDPWIRNRWISGIGFAYNPWTGWSSALNLSLTFGSGFYTPSIYSLLYDPFPDPFYYNIFCDPLFNSWGYRYRPAVMVSRNIWARPYARSNGNAENTAGSARDVVRGGRQLRGGIITTGNSRSKAAPRRSSVAPSSSRVGRQLTNSHNNSPRANGRTRDDSSRQNRSKAGSDIYYRGSNRTITNVSQPSKVTRRSVGRKRATSSTAPSSSRTISRGSGYSRGSSPSNPRPSLKNPRRSSSSSGSSGKSRSRR